MVWCVFSLLSRNSLYRYVTEACIPEVEYGKCVFGGAVPKDVSKKFLLFCFGKVAVLCSVFCKTRQNGGRGMLKNRRI